MDVIQAKRDRLLVRTAQFVDGAVLLSALGLLCTPETIGTAGFWVALPFLAAMAGFTALFASRAWLWMYTGFVLLVFVAAFLITGVSDTLPLAARYAIVALLGAALPGTSFVLLTRRFGHLVYWIVAAAAVAVAWATLGTPAGRFWYAAPALPFFGWAIAYAAGLVLVRSVPDALMQVREIGLAHRTERQASELEANRRQSARLLHDTVLATLTLLAHSGVGVSPDALRNQARNDAHLLRQLRLGEPLFALPGAQYVPEPVEESTLGTTLESVRTRFDGLGLDVAWHGANRIALPQRVLDAFLFSISESLENVRRHSGVTSAHVTVTESDTKVTAMITDAGKGFAPDEVSSQRLGIKESVIGRLAEIGGTAKVFSAPGAGTTVLLEVPR